MGQIDLTDGVALLEAPEPAPWWALNGLGMLVAFLEIQAGILGIVRGPNGMLGWVFRVGILVAGVVLVGSYIRRNVKYETRALILIAAANLIDLLNELLTKPFDLPETSLVIQAMIIFGVVSRIWALGKGGTFTVPPQRNGN